MSNVITAFKIAIGYDTEELQRGERELNRSMDNVKSGFTQVGAGITAVMIGAGVRVNDLAKQATNLDNALYSSTGATTWAQGFGAAIKQAGGDAEEALAMIRRADQMRDQLSIGQGAWVDELARIGFDTGDLSQATDSEDLIRRISTQFSQLSGQQQRLAKESLGLSDASFKVFQQGGDALERQVQALQSQLGYSQDLLNQQKEYTQRVIEAELAWDKLGNTVSKVMLPAMTELVKKTTPFINSVDSFIKKHPEATERVVTAGTVVAGGATLAGIGTLGSKIGIPGVGVLRGAGPIGIGLGVAYGANEFADWVDENSGPKKQLSDNGQYYKDSWVGQGVNWLVQPQEQPDLPEIGYHLPRSHGQQPMMSGYTPSYIEPEAANSPYLDHKALMSGYQPSYLESQYAGGMSDSAIERMGEKMVTALRGTGAINVRNDVNLTAHVELDGRKVGTLIDDRITQHNQSTLDDMTIGEER